ncbi:hypothetical protein P7K49_032931 [Saguinus oedipus]|uniref:Uncharacterized protein n=1 Tax=Saguinus oedipus TaxID=9490 RepID=A0ABQ9TQT9_SAGOE|nr:hypothetical protein P7K49_032931 [Saguinus oedipus]
MYRLVGSVSSSRGQAGESLTQDEVGAGRRSLQRSQEEPTGLEVQPSPPSSRSCPTDLSCPSCCRLTLLRAEPCLAMDQDYERRLLRQIVIQNENTMPRVSAPTPPTTAAPLPQLPPPQPAASGAPTVIGWSPTDHSGPSPPSHTGPLPPRVSGLLPSPGP